MSTHEEDIANLPKEAEPARDLWPGIEARIAGRPPRRASALLRLAAVLRPAAALLLFASGVAVGLVWGRSSAAGAPPVQRPMAAAEEVQRTGTEYVAAVAALREETRSEVRTQGREAALSTVYGAAHELTRLSPDDPDASRLLSTASRARRGGRSIRF